MTRSDPPPGKGNMIELCRICHGLLGRVYVPLNSGGFLSARRCGLCGWWTPVDYWGRLPVGEAPVLPPHPAPRGKS